MNNYQIAKYYEKGLYDHNKIQPAISGNTKFLTSAAIVSVLGFILALPFLMG